MILLESMQFQCMPKYLHHGVKKRANKGSENQGKGATLVPETTKFLCHKEQETDSQLGSGGL